MQQKFKVNLPDFSTTILIQVDQTLQDIVDIVLRKLNIPVIYGEVCGIFKQNFDKLQLLQKEQRIKHFFEASATYIFRIIVLPQQQHLSDLHHQFHYLLYKQINFYLVNEQYLIPAQKTDLSYTLSALNCILAYGPFSPQKYKEGFLANVLKMLPVPASVFQQLTELDVEDEIFAIWQKMSDDSAAQNKSPSEIYLNSVFQQIPAAGTFVIEGENEEAKKDAERICSIGVGLGKVVFQKNKDLVTRKGDFSNTYFDYDKQVIKIVQNVNFFKMSVKLSNCQQIIEFVQYCSFYEDKKHVVEAAETESEQQAEKSIYNDHLEKNLQKKHSTAHSSNRSSVVDQNAKSKKRKHHSKKNSESQK